MVDGLRILAALALFLVPLQVSAQEGVPDMLPRPDGKPADMSKPVQVYILMGSFFKIF